MALLDDLKAARARARKMPSRKKRAKKTAKKVARRPRGELLGMTGDLPWRLYREPKETDYHYNLRRTAMKMAMSHVKPAEVLAHPVKR